MSRALHVYFSLQSPWAYIGHATLQGLAAKHGLDIRYRPVALSQVFPESGGLPLAKRHPLRQRYRIVELQRWREKRGMDFHLRPQFWPFDPATGDRIVCAMTLAGVDSQKFIAAAFAGAFERQLDLADRHVLARLLDEAGYGSEWLERGEGGESELCYQRNLALALEAGVFGSPSYVLDGEVFWGQDRLELLDDALTSGRKPFSADA
ncbi:2-hydroxychromene-2-carboxylate isomerase [Rhodoblastus sp.]|jgi:2-hydroxychromene-2-carboxylate isomerase|uniref:2-hydroxychromene-2-carboxylate isomerase n=1 Tax=Rhodoblastus sp. TaxID=1962975 RepID=UPI00261C5AC7|nr:2-hydroxychromene-2-carboxylate isomerase [Rhodoblastus sp.]